MESAEIVADWLAWKGNFTYGNASVPSVTILQKAFPIVEFANEPTDVWTAGNLDFLGALRGLGTITGSLKSTSTEASTALIFNKQPYQDAAKMIADKKKKRSPHRKNMTI